MDAKQRSRVIEAESRKYARRLTERLIKLGALRPDRSLEGRFKVVPRVTVSIEEEPLPKPAWKPANIKEAEWQTMLSGTVEPFTLPGDKYGRAYELTNDNISDVRAALARLKKRQNRPSPYGSILYDFATQWKVNGFLDHLKLGLQIVSFQKTIVGSRSGNKRKVAHVLLVRKPAQKTETPLLQMVSAT